MSESNQLTNSYNYWKSIIGLFLQFLICSFSENEKTNLNSNDLTQKTNHRRTRNTLPNTSSPLVALVAIPSKYFATQNSVSLVSCDL